MNTCVNTLLKDFLFPSFKPRSRTSDPPENKNNEDFTTVMKLEKYCSTIQVDWKFPKNLFQDHPLSKVAWAYPKEHKLCMRCEKIFVFNRWPHHCRACGVTICNSCTYNAKVKDSGERITSKKAKVCSDCHSKRFYCKVRSKDH